MKLVNNELEAMIPSEYVRQCVNTLKIEFSDRAKAAMIYHNENLLFLQKLDILQQLCTSTADVELKNQIATYISHAEESIVDFQHNADKQAVYILTVREYEDETFWDTFPTGYYFDFEKCYSAGKAENYPFKIEKRFIEGDEAEKFKHHSPAIYHDDSGEITEFDDPTQGSEYDADEIRDTFLECYYNVIDVFDRGDIVFIPRLNKYGVVDTSKADWNKFEDRVLSGEFRIANVSLDWTDVCITVHILNDDGVFHHDHYNPMELEMVKLSEDSDAWSPQDRLLNSVSKLYRGYGSLEDFLCCQADYKEKQGK